MAIVTNLIKRVDDLEATTMATNKELTERVEALDAELAELRKLVGSRSSPSSKPKG